MSEIHQTAAVQTTRSVDGSQVYSKRRANEGKKRVVDSSRTGRKSSDGRVVLKGTCIFTVRVARKTDGATTQQRGGWRRLVFASPGHQSTAATAEHMLLRERATANFAVAALREGLISRA